MTSVLMIVSRNSPRLYSYVCHEFEVEGLGTEIDVVLDRRHGQRRGRLAALPSERRLAERRAYAIDEDLRGLGWALVRREASPAGPAAASASGEATAEEPAD